MKITPLLLAFLAFLALLSLTSASSDVPMQRRNMPGGYSPGQIDNPEIIKAGAFAVSALAESTESYSFSARVGAEAGYKVNVAKVFQQVVAGMNFRMVVLIEDAQGICVGAFKVTVYDHFGDMSVTQWGKEVECHKAKAALESREKFDTDDEDSNE
jgi:hypothetical protein